MFIDLHRDVQKMRHVILNILLREELDCIVNWAAESGDAQVRPVEVRISPF
jgi:hypothetical protein